MISEESTVGEVREWLREQMLDGTRCPCCHRKVKVYRRKLHRTIARALIHMYWNRGADGLFDITTHLLTHNGDTAKLRYWGLISPGPEEGVWALTEKGELFVRGLVRVPSHAETYNGVLLEVNGDEISIRDALGARFDYDELMATRGTIAPDLGGDDDGGAAVGS